jgi:transcriptional regulator with XRE-family HTH domain
MNRHRKRREYLNMSTHRDRDQQERATFGQAVRELREQRGMSVSDLSNASKLARGRKMSERRIGRIEAGEVDARFEELMALADALGVTAGTLLEDAEGAGLKPRVPIGSTDSDRHPTPLVVDDGGDPRQARVAPHGTAAA